MKQLTTDQVIEAARKWYGMRMMMGREVRVLPARGSSVKVPCPPHYDVASAIEVQCDPVPGYAVGHPEIPELWMGLHNPYPPAPLIVVWGGQ
jgi:hypothetical protein